MSKWLTRSRPGIQSLDQVELHGKFACLLDSTVVGSLPLVIVTNVILEAY